MSSFMRLLIWKPYFSLLFTTIGNTKSLYYFRKHYLFTTTWLYRGFVMSVANDLVPKTSTSLMLSTALLLIEMQEFRSPIVILTNLHLQFMLSAQNLLKKAPIIATYMKSSLLFYVTARNAPFYTGRNSTQLPSPQAAKIASELLASLTPTEPRRP